MLDDSTLKDLSPSLRLLCHQLPRQPVKHQQKHGLFAHVRLWRVSDEDKVLPEASGHPRLVTALGIGCLQIKHFTRCWRSSYGKFTHCLSTPEGTRPPCLQLRGCRCSPDLEEPGIQLLSCSSAPAQVSETQDAQE